MSNMFLRRTLSAPGLLRVVRGCFERIEDGVANWGLNLTDCLMSGLVAFGLKHPSLLRFDRDMLNAPRREPVEAKTMPLVHRCVPRRALQRRRQPNLHIRKAESFRPPHADRVGLHARPRVHAPSSHIRHGKASAKSPNTIRRARPMQNPPQVPSLTELA